MNFYSEFHGWHALHLQRIGVFNSPRLLNKLSLHFYL